MTNHRQDERQTQSAIQGLLNMFRLSNAPSLPLNSDEDVDGDVDEPPDEPPLPSNVDPAAAQQDAKVYTRDQLRPGMTRRVSLLTRALMAELEMAASSPPKSPTPPTLSRASTFSTASMPSTAELTSNMDDTSPVRSATLSPPMSSGMYPSTTKHQPATQPVTRPATELKEPETEANLGRKRCIMFASAEKLGTKESPSTADGNGEHAQPPPKRKCMLTFACPARPAQTSDQLLERAAIRRHDGGSPPCNESLPKDCQKLERPGDVKAEHLAIDYDDERSNPPDPPIAPRQTPHAPEQLAVGNEPEDAWVHEPIDSRHKMTLYDCMRKENAIRKIGEEAEEEAEQEDDEQDEVVDEDEDGYNEDDFAPSDDGNESDNEAGFADSDQESDVDSEDQLWVPSNAPVATSIEQMTPGRRRTNRRGSDSSSLSSREHRLNRQKTTESITIKQPKDRHLPKAQHLRPDLPDSTDFVCGTLDEDRPLEAAYMSCLERKKRDKYIPMPQDIDPSFPTTDPEDMDDDDDQDLGDAPEDHLWLKDQLEGFEDDPKRKHSSHHPLKSSTRRSPHHPRFSPTRSGLHRSPPPPRHSNGRAASPPQRRLFGHSPKRLQSPPPPPARLKSPPGTKRPSLDSTSPMAYKSQGLMISRLAQRPHMMGTSSLPHTPNPFFYRGRARLQQSARDIRDERAAEHEAHVRGPVDIVIGLEKKRQKQKERFWRQHCRKAAREHADRKTIIPGRGAERMRELGLECAERTRGYGLVAQQRPLMLSL